MPEVNVGGRPLYYEVHGEGEPMLCLGGWGSMTGERFSSIHARLRDRYRIIVADYPGIGASTDPGTMPGTAPYATMLGGLLDHLALGPVHVQGKGGLGAGVAMHLAARYPDAVRSLVVSQGWMAPEPYHHMQQEIFYLLLRDAGFDAFLKAAIVFGYLPEYVNERLREDRGAFDFWNPLRDRREAHLALVRAVMEHDATDRLAAVKAPTLVVYSEHDAMGGRRLAAEVAAGIADAVLHEIPDAPHVIRSVPGADEAYSRVVDEFFREH
ncbi:alpha/beta fold hydrolase [Streptosporangium sp. NPDC004631]